MTSGLLYILWFITLALRFQGGSGFASLSKIACHGETITIRCGQGELIRISDATYQLLEENSPLCRHVNRTSTKCRAQPLREHVASLCGGRDVCRLGQGMENDVRKECVSSLYLKVTFDCIKMVRAIPAIASTQRPGDGTSLAPTGGKDAREISAYFQLLTLFLELKSVTGFIARNPRKAVLCLILSLAFGISLIIVYMLIIACCVRFGRNKRNDSASDVARDDTDGVKAMLISTPVNTSSSQTQRSTDEPIHYETVLVTRQNGVPLHETTISSDSTLMTRKNKKNTGHAEVISTIKRTHSIDEGTQTDNEDADDNLTKPQRTLSTQEAQELGDLVNVLNYYNSRIDDDDAFYPQFSGKQFKSQSSRDESNNRPYEPPSNHDPRYYYANRGPSYEDEGRSSSNVSSSTADRQPLLINTNLPPQPSPYHSSRQNKLPSERKTLSRNPSEISYTTSASNTSDTSLRDYSPEAIFNGDNLRHNSIQRTPKPGVRGDGYDFIVNSSSRSTSSR